MEKYERLQALLTFIKNRFCGGKAAELARRIGRSDSYVNRLFYPQEKNGAKGIGTEIMDACTEAFSLPRGFWEMTPEEAVIEVSGPVDGTPGPVVAAAPGTPETETLDVLYARGSCGGGILITEYGDEVREQLVKEASWFRKYNIRPHQALVFYADGNSMAEFIVDGDIVIFRKGVNELVNGQIYAIETPDGLRIKRVLKRADGSIVLASDNENKRKYPDETYSPEQAARLQFKGSFVYRQGG
ncbi:helix-turn-helix transcriptional regulator [Variovorax sp. V15]|uniref:S24 family peptidase n=1 Tax=Variovorax sp. V15 TaxID=3065952 RepID=UPI0034E869DF